MNWIMGLFLSKNNKASLTKLAGWLIAIRGILPSFDFVTPDILSAVDGFLGLLAMLGIRNAIDKVPAVSAVPAAKFK